MTHSQPSSGADAARLLKAFLEVQRIRVTEDSLRMWVDALRDLSYQQLEEALRRFNREGTEYPNPASVRKYAGFGEASIDDRALVAWACVRKSVSRVGAYESVDFDDPITNAAIRNIGGWKVLCEMEIDHAQWREKEFIAAYKAIIRTGIGDGSALHGIAATANGRLGHSRNPPRRIETGLAVHAIASRLTGPKSPRIESNREHLKLKGPND